MANSFRKTDKTLASQDSYADMWGLYHTLALHLATQLRRFLEAEKRCYHCVPGGFDDEKEWRAALRTMIRAFDLLATADCRAELRDPHLSEEEQEAVIQEGLKLFCHNFRNLWL